MKQKTKTWFYGCLILLSSITVNKSIAQVYTTCTVTSSGCNYVTNGDFEANDISEIVDYDPITGAPIYGCDALHATGYAKICGSGASTQDNVFHGCSWTTSGWTYSNFATADYYNTCANTCWDRTSVNATSNFASNGIGSISPHAGNGYAGIYVYTAADAFVGGSVYYKESIKQSLSSTLIAGKTYIVSMWVRLSHHSKYAVSDFWINGINFTSTAITNKTGWTFLTTCYTPSSNVSNIEIGSNATTLTDLDPTSSWAPYGEGSGQRNKVSYYYIDDVKITPLSVDAGPDISIYPGCGSAIGTSTVTSFPCLSTISSSATIAYSWSPSTGLSSTNTATTIASPTTTTNYTVTATITYTNAAGAVSVCSSTDAVTVTVSSPTISITPSYTCNFNGVNSFTANVTPAGSYTYSWTVKDAATGTVVPVAGTGTTSATPSFSLLNVTQPVNVCVSITNTLGCVSTPTCYYLPNCCPTATNVIKYTNTTYTTSTIPAGTALAFGGTITVNSGGQLIIIGKDVQLEPNTKFVLNGTGRLVLTNDYVHGCGAMWDGIYANTTNTISLTTSRIEDAKRVIIDSLGTAGLSINGCYFNKNNVGIAFKAAKTSTSSVVLKNTLFSCSSIPTTGSVPYIPTVPNLTNASTLGAYSSAYMLPPYNTIKSTYGISFENASRTGTNSAITIGGATGEENVFDKMQLGIYSYDSKFNIQNNVIQNIKSSIAPSAYTNSGILLVGPLFGAGNGSYLNAGGSVALKNTFINNDYGLYNVGKSGILATYNTFSVQTTGAYVTGNNNGSIVGINNNNFYQNGIAVNFYNNTYLAGNVKNNNMNNTASAVGTYADNFAIRCTEAALATNPSTYPAFDIDNNNISGYYNGIYAVNTLSLIATDNEVHMRQDNTADHWQSGITVTGSNANKIINNTIDMASLNQWAYWQSGIAMTLNQVPRVQCNSINKLSMSINFYQNNSTAAGDGVKSNYMQNAKFGIWMHDNAVIGDQAGNTGTNSSDNVWNIPNIGTDTTYYTYMQGSSNPSSHIFFTRSLGSGFDIPSWKAKKDASINCNIMFGNNSAAAATGTACIGNTATPSNLRVAGNALASIMQGADDILTDFDNEENHGLSMASASSNVVDNSADNTVSIKAMNRRHLLYNLVLQNIDVQQDVALSGFMNSIKSNNTGLLVAVDSLIHQAEKKSSAVIAAQQANAAIVPTNLVEQGQQEFNTLYLLYLAQNKTLNGAELSSLETLALLCPTYYGSAVYQARTVLFDIKKRNYVSDCEKVSPPKKAYTKRLANNTQSQSNTDVTIYPNPAHNQLFVDAVGYSTINLKLYNIMGELVMDKSIANANSIDISTLSSGIYTYKVFSSDSELKVGKLIITH